MVLLFGLVIVTLSLSETDYAVKTEFGSPSPEEEVRGRIRPICFRLLTILLVELCTHSLHTIYNAPYSVCSCVITPSS